MDTPRRHVLAAAATGSTLGLPGCGDLIGSDNAAEQTDGDNEGGVDNNSEARATIVIDVQEEIQAAQEEIGTRVQEGNLSQEEAQAELRETQIEVISAAIEDVRTYVADTDDLTVENANEQAGAVLVAGSAAAVLGTLDADSVNALLSATDFSVPQAGGESNGA